MTYHDAFRILLVQNNIPLPGIPCIHSSVDGHTGYSYFEIAMNSAAVKMCKFVLFGIFEIGF